MGDYKTIVDATAHGTIRVTLEFEKGYADWVKETRDYKLLHLLSIWSGADKTSSTMFSFELPMSLKPYLEDVYGNRKDCIVNL